jgi:hypothetical protein
MAQKYDALDRALDAESWAWLEEQHPVIADAVQVSIERGAEPDAIKRRVLMRTGRWELALRCELAARWLVDQGE